GDGEVRHLLARHGGRVIDSGYDETGGVRLAIDLPEAAAADFAEALLRLTRGAWRVEAESPRHRPSGRRSPGPSRTG
ncbi:MAG TPA: DUF1949 domain-containing protein, partial [Candidatus Polarisedimenticolia bacterium]|nr:DUF1949 domain-containing protein [Candidatus Polarisedimenticolia bacterium]